MSGKHFIPMNLLIKLPFIIVVSYLDMFRSTYCLNGNGNLHQINYDIFRKS